MSVGETDSSQTVQNIHMLQHVIPTIPRTWSCLKGYLTQFWCKTIHKHKWNICIYYTFSFLTIMLMTKFRTDAIWWSHLQLMQVVPSGGQICNLCKWLHLVAKFATNASGAMLLLNLIQVTESISGSVVPLAMFCCLSRIGDMSIYANIY